MKRTPLKRKKPTPPWQPRPPLYRGGCPRRPGDLNYVGPVKPTPEAVEAWLQHQRAEKRRSQERRFSLLMFPRGPVVVTKTDEQRAREVAMLEEIEKTERVWMRYLRLNPAEKYHGRKLYIRQLMACNVDDAKKLLPVVTKKEAEKWQAAETERLAKIHGKKRKPRKPLPKQSAKRKARNAEYEAAVKQWRAGHDGRCEMILTVSDDRRLVPAPRDSLPRTTLARCGGDEDALFRCRRKAGPRPHHMALRGPNLCNVATFMGVCRQCHDWIHAHPKEARRLGYLTK